MRPTPGLERPFPSEFPNDPRFGLRAASKRPPDRPPVEVGGFSSAFVVVSIAALPRNLCSRLALGPQLRFVFQSAFQHTCRSAAARGTHVVGVGPRWAEICQHLADSRPISANSDSGPISVDFRANLADFRANFARFRSRLGRTHANFGGFQANVFINFGLSVVDSKRVEFGPNSAQARPKSVQYLSRFRAGLADVGKSFPGAWLDGGSKSAEFGRCWPNFRMKFGARSLPNVGIGKALVSERSLGIVA